MGNIKFFTFILLLSIWGDDAIAVNGQNTNPLDANASVSCSLTSPFCNISDGNVTSYSLINPATTAAGIPLGRPNPPTAEFYTNTADPYQRAVCGSNDNQSPLGPKSSRIPVLANYEPLKISTSFEPYSTLSTGPSNNLTGDYRSVRGVVGSGANVTGDWTYLYSTMSRCVCMGAEVSPINPQPSLPALTDYSAFSGGNFVNNTSGNYSRIYPDTFDVISTQDQSSSVKYNMVAMAPVPASGPLVDGRIGSVFKAGGSFCGCPNINETPRTNDTSGAMSTIPDITNLVGVHCEANVTGVDGDAKGRILTTYNSAIHHSQVINKPIEGIGTDNVIDKILLPTSAGGTQTYNRKIWTCAPPYTLNLGSKQCELTSIANHACQNDTNFPSPVSSALGSVNFDNIVNKKLACCMNQAISNTADPRLKFDCVDNSQNVGTSFNNLWHGSDDSEDGGQPYAMVLAGVGGKYLTGFYTLDGARCEQFNEFGIDISTAKIKMNAGAWSIVSTQANAIPASHTTGTSASGVLPTTAAEMRRCPILVRAAMVATCPENPELPVVQKTYLDSDTGKKHCTHASSIQVHVRIEQVYEIEGMAPMKPVDTVAEQRSVSSISVEKIIANKISDNTNGGCPPGSSKQGDVCVYQ